MPLAQRDREVLMYLMYIYNQLGGNTNLKNQIAVITGAGGAICGEITKAYAREGVYVSLWDLSFRVI